MDFPDVVENSLSRQLENTLVTIYLPWLYQRPEDKLALVSFVLPHYRRNVLEGKPNILWRPLRSTQFLEGRVQGQKSINQVERERREVGTILVLILRVSTTTRGRNKYKGRDCEVLHLFFFSNWRSKSSKGTRAAAWNFVRKMEDPQRWRQKQDRIWKGQKKANCFHEQPNDDPREHVSRKEVPEHRRTERIGKVAASQLHTGKDLVSEQANKMEETYVVRWESAWTSEETGGDWRGEGCRTRSSVLRLPHRRPKAVSGAASQTHASKPRSAAVDFFLGSPSLLSFPPTEGRSTNLKFRNRTGRSYSASLSMILAHVTSPTICYGCLSLRTKRVGQFLLPRIFTADVHV